MKNKPLGIPYGIWFIIIWLGISAFSKLVWVQIFLYQNDGIVELAPLFFADMLILVVTLIIMYGLFKTSRWAYIILIGLLFIDILTAFVLAAQIGPGSSVVKTIFGIIIIFYLFQPGVRSYFGLDKN